MYCGILVPSLSWPLWEEKFMENTSEKKRQIKVLLPEDDHDMVRLSAALVGTNMAEFCRDVVLQEARRLTKDIRRPHSAANCKKGSV